MFKFITASLIILCAVAFFPVASHAQEILTDGHLVAIPLDGPGPASVTDRFSAVSVFPPTTTLGAPTEVTVSGANNISGNDNLGADLGVVGRPQNRLDDRINELQTQAEEFNGSDHEHVEHRAEDHLINRDEELQRQIEQGVASGVLSREEADHLEHGLSHIEGDETQALADGRLSKDERQTLFTQLNNEEQRIQTVESRPAEHLDAHHDNDHHSGVSHGNGNGSHMMLAHYAAPHPSVAHH